jgi:hypothetical protein
MFFSSSHSPPCHEPPLARPPPMFNTRWVASDPPGTLLSTIDGDTARRVSLSSSLSLFFVCLLLVGSSRCSTTTIYGFGPTRLVVRFSFCAFDGGKNFGALPFPRRLSYAWGRNWSACGAFSACGLSCGFCLVRFTSLLCVACWGNSLRRHKEHERKAKEGSDD